MQLNFSQLQELLTVLSDSDIAEFDLKGTDFELHVKRGSTGDPIVIAAPTTPVAVAPVPAPLPAPTPAAAPPAGPLGGEKFLEITAPMVGTFYRAPAPEEPPFVNVGDRIQVGQTVCILEAMKLMNELESEVTGEVVEILVQNGEPVEFNQPLFRLRPL
ncbi:acetyl-CoA carboxylase biotin carboxyl carrier protein [Synechococcus elongatus]|uniref:Biotin carboxyl carrier protein of acetyl-CoA carboxylase n=2 Tax=Synechococcus elongatus TaxID=32046 RepID=Q54761_SYNE7|nr:acetyl-CoA carboxylase biotin carboxyl carrier protein [Synechococcus elongatus]MBD2688383.1 acetyl-CoA carboxylase biotin carboxyl carrier protein [Synechococcus elongatus FACHB-1061]AAB82026.1 biotin carboxyl carrier protein [Synechococcus elongatus PCC 7942 = FACHB-805]ABB58594.1 biotin carboxyl carrier protein [Synechococcus elongatus PCC 7942 = FACHB-805]AJD56953.1 acetyl-CoA carboxylase [Synechococcus elongatus UTEX 2973]MBD2587314.1 acetyl-CoA carboxylase biotin carboxyl carrier prot